MSSNPRPAPGDTVVLVSVPPELLRGLPEEDQKAIVARVGRTALLAGYDEDGRAELEWDEDPVPFRRIRTIFVDPVFIRKSS